MTTTRRVNNELGTPDDETIRQIIARASSSTYDMWWKRVTASGHCAHPIQLTRQTTEGAALVFGRCKNRRAAVCPSCSDLYAGDTWHLVHAGLEGGQDIPSTVAEHPAVFATLTAPSFGRVHSTRADDRGAPRPCQPTSTGLCGHGRSVDCLLVHEPDDVLLGQPLCSDCYDYLGHVLTTWYTPKLWSRFTTSLRRLIRPPAAANVRVSFVKVVEMQTRLIPHIHAVVRLDAKTDSTAPEPPARGVKAAELAALIRRAASAVELEVPAPGGEVRTLRFGTQVDTQTLTVADDMEAGSSEARKVAGYLANYVTKSVADSGLYPHRISPAAIELLNVTDHTREILRAAVQLSEMAPEYAGMTDWLHTLGYRGHVTTKSRRYSTTMRELRARRTEHERASGAHRDGGEVGHTEDIEWSFTRAGHKTPGDRYLALSAALKHREENWAARQLGDISTPVAPIDWDQAWGAEP